jgi:hypothetical protein
MNAEGMALYIMRVASTTRSTFCALLSDIEAVFSGRPASEAHRY